MDHIADEGIAAYAHPWFVPDKIGYTFRDICTLKGIKTSNNMVYEVSSFVFCTRQLANCLYHLQGLRYILYIAYPDREFLGQLFYLFLRVFFFVGDNDVRL